MAYGYDETESEATVGSRSAKLASFILVGKILSFLLAGASFVIVARILGASTYGLYTLAVAVSGFFGSVGNFGIGSAINRFLSKKRGKKGFAKSAGRIVSDSIAGLLILTFVLFVVTIALSGTIASYFFHDAALAVLIDIAALTIVTLVVFDASYYALVGAGLGSRVSESVAAMAFFQAFVSIALALDGVGAASPIIGLVVGNLAGTAAAMYFLYKSGIHLVRPRIDGIRRIYRFAFPIGVSNIFGLVVSNLGLIILGIVSTSVVIGNFGVASRVGYLIDIVTGSMSISILSLFSSALGRRMRRSAINRFYNYATYYALLAVAPVVVTVVALAKPFSYTVFGSGYSVAPLFIALLGIGSIISIIGGYISLLFIAAGKVRKFLKYAFIIFVLEFVFVVPLVALEKGFGLALGLFIASPIIADTVLILAGKRVFGVRTDFGRLARVGVANVVSIIIPVLIELFSGLNYIVVLLLSILCVIIVYPAALYASGAAKSNDISLVSEATSQIPLVGRFIKLIERYFIFIHGTFGGGSDKR